MDLEKAICFKEATVKPFMMLLIILLFSTAFWYISIFFQFIYWGRKELNDSQ